MRSSPLVRLALALTLLSGCPDEDAPPAGRVVRDSGVTNATCRQDDDCDADERCVAGVCEARPPADAGEAPAPDAGPGPGRVTVMPDRLDFGAVVFGTSTERTVTITNVGDGPLEILTLFIEDDATSEFSVFVSAGLPQTLEPQQPLIVRVTYTPVDGTDDNARLLVVSDDRTQVLASIPLTSEFKGVSEVAVVERPADDMPELRVLDFGSVPVGSAATRSFYVKNIGSGTNPLLSVTSVRTEPVRSLNFSVSTSTSISYLNRFDGSDLCDGGAPCPNGRTCDPRGLCLPLVNLLEVTVTFAPREANQYAEQVVLTTDEARQTGDELVVSIDVLGLGIEPRIAVTPDPISVGSMFAGTSTAVPVTVRRDGRSDVTVQALTVTGTPSLSLDLGAVTLPAVLTSSQSELQVMIRAAPGTAGLITGTLEVTSTDRLAPTRRVAISGISAPPPRLQVTARHDFGEVHVVRGGNPGPRVTLTVENRGGSRLLFGPPALAAGSAASLSLQTAALPTLSPGGRGTLDVVFSPTAVGTSSGALVLTSNDPDRPMVTVDLTGVGIDPDASVTPARLDFGGIFPGAASVTTTVTVTNTGAGPLVVSRITASAGSSPDFSLVGVPAVPVRLASQGDRVAFGVRYVPGTVGPDTGAIQVASNDLDNPIVSIPMTGNGSSCAPNTFDIDGDPRNGCEYFCVRATPPVELCNGADDDCNGAIDDGFNLGAACSGTGECGAGVLECSTVFPTVAACSTDPGQSNPQPQPETCDGRDEDCDGVIDDGFDLDRDINNCGACNNVCSVQDGTPECVRGGCRVFGCDVGFADCDAAYGNGCEINTDTDIDHCGACTAACRLPNATPQCAAGRCTIGACLPGYADCDGIASNGCEVDTRASITDCGACNNVCTVTNGAPACSGGACVVGTCDANFGDCDGDYATGCEQRLDTLANCGVCGQVCDAPNASETCVGGVCRVGTCDPAWGDCDSNVLNGCETRIDTPLNCGSCGAACVANELCCGTSCRIASASDCGSCGATCDPGMLVVSEVMIDPVAVPDNQGEWIEVYNTTTSTIDLRGFTLRDDGADVHIITDFTPVVVPAGGYVTLGRNANLASNGGVVVDYQYASFVLGNAGDEVVLDAFGTVIDRVAYGASFDIPAAATQLSQGTLTSTANDDPLNWCAATATLTGGDRGTPGADNRTCP